jgi:hypothetical protein
MACATRCGLSQPASQPAPACRVMASSCYAAAVTRICLCAGACSCHEIITGWRGWLRPHLPQTCDRAAQVLTLLELRLELAGGDPGAVFTAGGGSGRALAASRGLGGRAAADATLLLEHRDLFLGVREILVIRRCGRWSAIQGRCHRRRPPAYLLPTVPAAAEGCLVRVPWHTRAMAHEGHGTRGPWHTRPWHTRATDSCPAAYIIIIAPWS